VSVTASSRLHPDRRHALLEVASNLSRYHREHEKFYGEAPLNDAAALLRISRTLKALAEGWSRAGPVDAPAANPYAGAVDLNDERAIETTGVLFMESGQVPAEIVRLLRDLDQAASDAEATGTWLMEAMDAAWSMASNLLDVPELADLLGERHRIIANDWQNAVRSQLAARQLRRAREILERIDFTVAGLRSDLAGRRRSSDYLFSAAELIDQTVDLIVQSTVLVRQNERPWRVFHARVSQLLMPPSAKGETQCADLAD
jgi:hypothetical protein